MAKLNGVQIKSLRKFKDHEGFDIYQGTIYVDGKKVGAWSNDFMFGPDVYTPSDIENIIGERAAKFAKGYPANAEHASLQSDPDIFMMHLVHLCLDEKIFKQMEKKGAKVVGYVKSADKRMWRATGYYKPVDIETVKTTLHNCKYAYIHGGENGFDILVDEAHPAGERFFAD